MSPRDHNDAWREDPEAARRDDDNAEVFKPEARWSRAPRVKVEVKRGRTEVVSAIINGRHVTVQQRRKNFAISV
jgi:hypothetical protein